MCMCTPALLCEWLLEAIKCVPSVKGVEIYNARGSARMASLLPKGVDRPQAQRRPFAGIAQRPQSQHFF